MDGGYIDIMHSKEFKTFLLIIMESTIDTEQFESWGTTNLKA